MKIIKKHNIVDVFKVEKFRTDSIVYTDNYIHTDLWIPTNGIFHEIMIEKQYDDHEKTKN